MTERKCPMCGRPAELDYRPFCSRRCADLDLQKWLSGAYAAPAVEEDQPDAAARFDPDED